MVNSEAVRLKAVKLAHRHRGLGESELREWFGRLECNNTSTDDWSVFRSAYFDALWAGAEEFATRPVVTHTGFPKCKPLTGCAHLTLAFVASHRLELLDMSVESEDN
jgi:hypothetical protein